MKLKYVPSLEGFLALEQKVMGPAAEADALVIPFGIEASVSYGGGTAEGPAAILAASAEVETFDELWWSDPAETYGVATLEAPKVPRDLPDALGLLADIVESALEADHFPLVLGGEHSLTPGAIRPFLRRHPDLALLHIDAHADLRDGYLGEKFSHAAAVRRCLDAPHLDVVSIGIRNVSKECARYMDRNRDRVRVHWGRDRHTYDPVEICKPLRGRPVYLTFDLDAFDSSVMPATGTPEPGGLFWDDVMPILAEVASVAKIVGADVVELAPLEGQHAADFVAAKLCYRILSFALLGAPKPR